MNRADRAALAAWLALAGAIWPGREVRAQAIQRGFELERAGRPGEAAEVYLAAVRAQPANVAALLGLERVLPGLGRLGELAPLVERALSAEPGSDLLRGLLVRTYVAVGAADSAEAVALRWAQADPRDEQPFREWAIALQDAGRPAEARRVLLRGRRALGRPDALAIEWAELAERAGAWEEAAREWGNAVAASARQLPTAAERLRDVPEARRRSVLVALTAAEMGPAPRRLAAELMLAWGDPDGAWALFERTLSGSGPEAASALRRFADLAGASGTASGRRVRGLALARFAELVPPQLASRARVDAARALLDAGDHVAARRVLEALAAAPGAPPEVQALAHTALIRALIEQGQLDLASGRLDSLGDALDAEHRAGLRLELARARLERGELDAAEAALAADSGLEAVALRGWIALYRGDLARAATLLRQAGPYAGRPGDATDRAQVLALLQRLDAARSPELGAALLLLGRGDSLAAVTALARAAERAELAAGRPELLLLAGQVAARLGGAHRARAVAFFDAVVRAGGDGAAPAAAELEWARVLLQQGRPAEAIEHLERLILTYPGSAVVPQARRELERARGAVPRS